MRSYANFRVIFTLVLALIPVQKSVIQCKLDMQILDYDWLINKRLWSGPMKSFVFKSRARPGGRNLWRKFYLSFVIRVYFFCLTISHFFMYGLVHFFWPLKNLLVLIYSKLHSKSCDNLYNSTWFLIYLG